MKTINFSNVTFGYSRHRNLFQGLSFKFATKNEGKGHIVALMGSSGSGKSTLLNLILQTIRPLKGQIDAEPKNPLISYIPQEPVLFEHLSPEANARYFSHLAFYKKYFDEGYFRNLSKALGMDIVFKQSKHIGHLSGGQRQRLMLLRALSIKPDILLLDEPTNGLDSEVKMQFLSQLRALVVHQNILTIYVTHHKTETEFIADEVAFLNSENDLVISKLYQRELSEFISEPPVLDAATIFRYPSPNIIKGLLEQDTLFILDGTLTDYCYAVVPPSAFAFNKNYEIPFIIVSTNSIFSVIMINNQQATVETCDLLFQPNMKISIIGEALIYSSEKIFLCKKNIVSSSIIPPQKPISE